MARQSTRRRARAVDHTGFFAFFFIFRPADLFPQARDFPVELHQFTMQSLQGGQHHAAGVDGLNVFVVADAESARKSLRGRQCRARSVF